MVPDHAIFQRNTPVPFALGAEAPGLGTGQYATGGGGTYSSAPRFAPQRIRVNWRSALQPQARSEPLHIPATP